MNLHTHVSVRGSYSSSIFLKTAPVLSVHALGDACIRSRGDACTVDTHTGKLDLGGEQKLPNKRASFRAFRMPQLLAPTLSMAIRDPTRDTRQT